MKVILACCLLATTWACASRAAPPAGVPSPPTSKPPEPPSPPVTVPEPVPPPVSPAPRPEPIASECALISEPGLSIATVALGETVSAANAPRPSNESERLVFRQLYETLVRVDCQGRVVPGLASSWRRSIDGRTWIVTIRPDARFSDGTPVTSATVVGLWSRDGVGGDLQPHVDRLVQSIIAVDGETLAIQLRSERPDAPFALAHTNLAIVKPIGGTSWPLGTRSAQASSDRAAITITTARGASVRFLAARGDQRDLLDQSVDLLLTRDRAALDYAATLPHFQSIPLAWLRTEVLLSPSSAQSSPALSDAARQTLATDAVRGEARGAAGSFWWQGLVDCEIAPPRAHAAGWRPSNRVVYDTADGAARDLAERLVGLARYQRATGLAGEALALARRGGGDAAYVMSFDSHPFDPCSELQVVVEGAPWLDPETIVPLVDTRLRAIVRRGYSGVVSDWDGGLLIAGGDDPR